MPLFWLLYTGILGYILLRFSGFFFLGIEGWVGGVYRIQTFFGFLYFFYIYKAPYERGNFFVSQLGGAAYAAVPRDFRSVL